MSRESNSSPLPIADASSVKEALDETGLALVRGVETCDEVLVRLASSVGDLMPVAPGMSRLVDDIAPNDDGADGLDARPHSQRRSALMPHTDQSARADPPDFLVLACVANEGVGGDSVLVPVTPVITRLEASAPDLVGLLRDAVFPFFNVPKRDVAFTGSLLTTDPLGRVRTRFRDEAVRAGFVTMHRPSDDHVEAFEALSAAYHDPTSWFVHRLVPGDAVVFDNSRILHGRTEVGRSGRRHLKRLSGRYHPAVTS